MVFTTEAPTGQVVYCRLRTQTKIKNYFYGNIRYFLKLIVKHFHKKNTGFVNDIKTDTLLDLFDAKNSKNCLKQVFKVIRLYRKLSGCSAIKWKGRPANKLSCRIRRPFKPSLRFLSEATIRKISSNNINLGRTIKSKANHFSECNAPRLQSLPIQPATKANDWISNTRRKRVKLICFGTNTIKRPI
jgi:hypothetical protein